MKKTLFALFLALLFSSAAFGQASILGTWRTEFSESESGQEEDVSAEFSVKAFDEFTLSGNTYSRNFSMVMNISGESTKDTQRLDMKVTVKGSIKGTWTYVDGILSMVPDQKAKPNIEVESEGLPGIAKTLLVAPLKKEIKDALLEPEKEHVVSLTETEMVLREIPDPKKKDTEPVEDVTYKRK